MEIVNDTEGFANADNGLGSGDATIILRWTATRCAPTA